VIGTIDQHELPKYCDSQKLRDVQTVGKKLRANVPNVWDKTDHRGLLQYAEEQFDSKCRRK